MTLEMVRKLCRYNWWANVRLLSAAKQLTPMEFEVDLAGSFSSVQSTLLHVLWVELMFIRRWRGESTSDLASPPVFNTMELIEEKWTGLEKERSQLLDRLTESDLSRSISYTDSRGRLLSMPLWESLFHLINHSTYHRGQLASKLRQSGKVPPSTDFVIFCREEIDK